MAKLNSANFDVAIIHTIDFCTFGIMRQFGVKAIVWMSVLFLIEPMAWSVLTSILPRKIFSFVPTTVKPPISPPMAYYLSYLLRAYWTGSLLGVGLIISIYL